MLWSTMMYSSGMPALYLVAAVYYLFHFWMYKILLLHYFQTTSKFNEQLAVASVGMIKYGVFLHMLLGTFMYTNNKILSSSNVGTLSDLSQTLHEYFSKLRAEFFRIRLSQFHGQIYFTIFIFILLAFVSRAVVFSLVARCLKRAACCLRRAEREAEKVQEDVLMTQTDLLRDLGLPQLREFYKRINKEFNRFKEMKARGEYDQNILSESDARLFLRRLELRLQDVEATVDAHVASLLRSASKKKKINTITNA